MSEVLTPKVGDRVRLVHDDGDESTVTVIAENDDAIWGRGRGFYYDDGWSVVEILEKPIPPAGTLVKGVVDLGDGEEPFVGRSRGVAATPFYVITEAGVTGAFLARDFKSWEVIQ